MARIEDHEGNDDLREPDFFIPESVRENLVDFSLFPITGGYLPDGVGDADRSNDAILEAVSEAVIFDDRLGVTNDDEMYYFFGYSDHGRDVLSSDDDRPWPWPALIRITVSFVDPAQPDAESTYQMVFRVPVAERF